jgi:transcriptional regulator with XRE-family HTH domain
MDTIDRIFKLMESRSITAARLTREANLSNGLVGQWRQRKQNPSSDSIKKVADYFNVSTDYLLGKTDAKKPPVETEGLTFHIKDNNLRAEVEELVSAFLTLDRSGRILVTAKAIEEQRAQAACDAAKQINETA